MFKNCHEIYFRGVSKMSKIICAASKNYGSDYFKVFKLFVARVR